jgi:GNAT superfamily N-acetyltransferase
VDDLRRSAALLVAGAPPVGFARLEVVDSSAHLEQLSVHPSAMRQGHGARLVRAAEHWARQTGFTTMTLITFRDVPWNAPFYSALGFAPIDELTPELGRLREHEKHALGLDALGARVVMHKHL